MAFSDRAWSALRCAEEAVAQRGGYVETEHILLGLLSQDTAVVISVLAAMEVSVAVLREAVMATIGKVGGHDFASVTLSPQAQLVVGFAAVEAKASGCEWIGTDHLLLGLIREDSGAASGLLAAAGVDLAAFRDRRDVFLGGSGLATTDLDDGTAATTDVRMLLSAVRSAKRDAIDQGSYEEAFRLREQEKRLLQEIVRQRRRLG